MKLDILKKLTKLANNNPNEHEANSAARRVCKILEECDFRFDSINNIPKNKSSFNATYYDEMRDMDDLFNFLFGGRRNPYSNSKPPYPSSTWNDVNRNKEPEFKSHKPNYEYSKPKSEEYWGNREPTQTKPTKEQRNLKCKTCGRMILTVFTGLPDVFECNSCQWTAYTRTKV